MAKLSWQVTAIVLAILGGTTFLGYEHIFTAGATSSIYSSIVGGLLVGHFVTKNGSNNSGL